MIVAADFMRSNKARDSEFTTNDCNYLLLFKHNNVELSVG